jgi:iron complex transport system permease protein
VVAAVALGAVQIPLRDILAIILSNLGIAEIGAIKPSDEVIMMQSRLPRVLAASFIGLILAMSGSVMQGIFRNPLASPYLLGIASGASVGAAIVIVFKLREIFGPLALPISAFLGGAMAVSVIYVLSRSRDRKASSSTLILAGIAIGALFSAMTSFLIFVSNEQMAEILFWIMGSTSRASWSSLLWLIPIALIGAAILTYFARDLNALSLGDEGAQHLGIRPERTKIIYLGITTLMTGAAVAIAGTIGFIGLITPHAMRLILGPDHRYLLPASAIAGAIFLVVVDLAARTWMEPLEIPVGILSAFIGAPFFLYLLLTRRGGEMS